MNHFCIFLVISLQFLVVVMPVFVSVVVFGTTPRAFLDKCLQYDLSCVEWDVKPALNHS